MQLRRQRDRETQVQVSASPRTLCNLGKVTAALETSASSPLKWGGREWSGGNDPQGIFQALRRLCQTSEDLAQAQGSPSVRGSSLCTHTGKSSSSTRVAGLSTCEYPTLQPGLLLILLSLSFNTLLLPETPCLDYKNNSYE